MTGAATSQAAVDTSAVIEPRPNPDIYPAPSYVARHAAFESLVGNPRIGIEFARFEKTALSTKRLYTRLGRLSLLAAGITFSAIIYAMTLDHLLPEGQRLQELFFFRIGVALIAVSGLAMQLVLLFTPLKHHWLGARFVAERLRCLKFQAFLAAAFGGAEHEKAARDFTEDALGDFSFLLANPVAAMNRFDPEAALMATPSGVPVDTATLADLKHIYTTMRLKVQTEFSAKEAMDFKEKQKLPTAGSEVTFWLGIAAGYIDAIANFAGASEGWMIWLHFGTLWFFMLSALLLVRERGSAFNAAIERYERYEKDLVRVAQDIRHADTAEKFAACVRAGELSSLRELDRFCRETMKSTYLF